MDIEALFRISYGLYLVSSGDEKHGNGYIANTLMQVTAEPARFATCCNKDNYTAGIIQSTGAFAASVLHTETDPEIFRVFGYRSGKDTDKMSTVKIDYGLTGVPIVLNDAIAILEYRLEQTLDLGTHWLFVGDLQQAKLLDSSKEPITYLHYRRVRKGFAPKNAPTYVDKSKLVQSQPAAASKKYRCTCCGYIYDEASEVMKFGDLAAEWVCPLCSVGKEEFVEIL